MSTSFAIVGKQSTLLYCKVSLHPRNVNFMVVTWQVVHKHETQPSEIFSYFASQLITLCQVKNLDRWHKKSFTINCFQTIAYGIGG